MQKLHQVAAIAAALTAAFTAQAMAASPILGAPFDQVKAAYKGAVDAQTGDRRALELRDVDYAGVQWDKVDFVFDGSNHLSSLTMHSDHASYEQILSMVQAQSQPSGLLSVEDSTPSNDVQIRVCESQTGAVSVTYERAGASI